MIEEDTTTTRTIRESILEEADMLVERNRDLGWTRMNALIILQRKYGEEGMADKADIVFDLLIKAVKDEDYTLSC